MKLETLKKGHNYHIYNRGVNSTLIFKNDENKRYFLSLAEKHLSGKISILAYCLMDNHYHMAVEINEDEKIVIQTFSNLLNAYVKAFNKMFNRTGSLFEKHFKRKRIQDESYLRNVIVYIHTNPERHRITNDFSTYIFSSYSLFLSKRKYFSNLIHKKEEVIALFNDLDNFIYVHSNELLSEDSEIKNFK